MAVAASQPFDLPQHRPAARGKTSLRHRTCCFGLTAPTDKKIVACSILSDPMVYTSAEGNAVLCT